MKSRAQIIAQIKARIQTIEGSLPVFPSVADEKWRPVIRELKDLLAFATGGSNK